MTCTDKHSSTVKLNSTENSPDWQTVISASWGFKPLYTVLRIFYWNCYVNFPKVLLPAVDNLISLYNIFVLFHLWYISISLYMCTNISNTILEWFASWNSFLHLCQREPEIHLFYLSTFYYSLRHLNVVDRWLTLSYMNLDYWFFVLEPYYLWIQRISAIKFWLD